MPHCRLRAPDVFWVAVVARFTVAHKITAVLSGCLLRRRRCLRNGVVVGECALPLQGRVLCIVWATCDAFHGPAIVAVPFGTTRGVTELCSAVLRGAVRCGALLRASGRWLCGAGENVPLVKQLKARGEVEKWLVTLEQNMILTLKRLAKTAIQEYEKKDDWTQWIFEHPVQLVLTVSQIYWCKEVRPFTSGGGARDLPQGLRYTLRIVGRQAPSPLTAELMHLE